MVYKWSEICQRLWPTQCVICLSPGCGGNDICLPCRAQLPRNSHACVICALPLPTAAPGGSVCGRCMVKPPGFRRILAPFLFQTPIDALISDLKFGGQLRAGRLLGDLLAAEAAHAPRPQALVPVPLHPTRLRARGFNQSNEIALRLARRLQLPVLNRALSRYRQTPAQSQLDRKQRLKNLRAAFRGQGVIELEHVAVIDDVVTTGATADAVARVLRHCGVKVIDVWAVARTPDHFN